jgi:hypothetical protein
LVASTALSGYGKGNRRRGACGGLANFNPSQSAEIAVAVTMYEAGLDFAGALHLALSDGHDALLTFDERFVGRAQQSGTTPPVQAVR